MITLAQLIRDYQIPFEQTYQSQMQTRHYAAMHAIIDCHTPAKGELLYQCTSCNQSQCLCRSCGNRHCPACQYQSNNQWLDRQRQKLIPVNYFMVSFTLPRQLRGFVWHHQQWAYSALFNAAVQTLQSFYEKDKHLQCEPGLTGVLHTHSRRLDYHPHIHIISPGGGLDKKHRLWKQKAGKYLFKEQNLASVFRGKFISAMIAAGFYLPDKVPKKWICHCDNVGKGEPALVYLARYLYRGVLSESNIIEHKNGKVTFRYLESKTKKWQHRTVPAIDFLWLVLQHVLPKGFRRARDYGFLHGNAKKTLHQLQIKLRVYISPHKPKEKKSIECRCCGFAMQFVGIINRAPLDRPVPCNL